MTTSRIAAKVVLIAVTLLVSSCLGSRPDITYYQLSLDKEMLRPTDQGSDVVFSVESMIGDSAYEDPRIVFRKSPHRLDYYYYHRWTSPPGVMLSDFLRDAYERSGHFGTVVAGFSPEAPVFLSGRVVAFEEVDKGTHEWVARVKVNLFLREADTGEVMWSRTITKEVEVDELNPEGVAAAMSTAATAIVADTAPEFAKLALRAREKRKRKETRDDVLDSLEPQGDL